MKPLLFGITPHDPLTLVAAPVSLLVIAGVACLLPAARAARVDAMIAFAPSDQRARIRLATGLTSYSDRPEQE